MVSTNETDHICDVAIVGGGIAGLAVAFYLPESVRVALLFKSVFEESSTWVAQGGIAGYIVDADRPEFHIEDTLKAGDGLCHEPAVRTLILEGTERLREMLAIGVAFDRVGDEFDLALEGGHSHPRILHAGDRTGRAIAARLKEIVANRPNVTVVPGFFATELLVDEDGGRCVGVRGIAGAATVTVRAGATVLATGGAGQVFAETTNPASATGDGVALGFAVGAAVCDMEFYQFHPTVLADGSSPRLLITEALRGYGARLVDGAGASIMEGVHPLGDLAPRHVVTRRMAEVMAEEGRSIFLDARHFLPEAWSHFPFIYDELRRRGFSPERDLIPVSPAAHFMIGGIATDLHGRTRLPGLYACGEVASTGVHGANRLASNSLLEGLVFGRRIAACIADGASQAGVPQRARVPDGRRGGGELPGGERARLVANLRRTMWERVGLVRDEEGLREALAAIEAIEERLSRVDLRDQRDWELASMVLCARLITEGARARRETRGSHARRDFPERDDRFLLHFCHERQGLTAVCLVRGVSDAERGMA